MKRRPLCIFCVLFLTVQAIRVLFFGAGDYTSALGQIVNRNNKGEINLILTGTADRIDEKESVTAVRVKGNAVSFYSGSDRKIARQSVFGKSDGHRSSYDFSQELPRKIWEEKVLVYLEKEDAAHIKIGNKLKIKGKASAFETARNPGNFDQRAYYKRQKIGAYVWADEVGILSGQTECIRQFLHEFRQGWKKLLVGCLGSYYGNTISAILLGEKVWEPEYDPEFDEQSMETSRQLKTVYSRIAKKHGIDFLAASDVAEPSSRDREHMDEESHRRFAEAVYERLTG